MHLAKSCILGGKRNKFAVCHLNWPFIHPSMNFFKSCNLFFSHLVACAAFFSLNTSALLSQDCVELEDPLSLFTVASSHPSCSPTTKEESTIFLELHEDDLQQLQTTRPDAFEWAITFPSGEHRILELHRFQVHSSDFEIGHMTKEGSRSERYEPTLLSYRFVTAGVRGTFVVSNGQPYGVIRHHGIQYEIAALRCDEGGAITYALFDVSDAIVDTPFSCGVDDLEASTERTSHPPALGQRHSSITSCVEVALDIDFYTYNTFGSDCNQSVEWALALLAGVNEIYEGELNNLITLSASYINVWEETDPYASYVGNAGGMLDALRSEWLSNPDLSSRPRDLVHLLTRRNNTGTGGIAYLNVNCSNSYAAGFSSALSNSMSYNLNSYSWNLQVVAHELGHNFGSNHTHWCGWPGGPIDNCYSLEGSCGSYTDNPTAQTGTIMSYCHAVAGGSVNLEFHPTVENHGLIPFINSQGSCFNSCDEFASSCNLYGCTLSQYCNYDPEAEINDGSCTSEDICGECGGNGSSCTGCTDPIACNYLEGSLIDDASCFYSPNGGACDCEALIPLSGELAPGEMVSIAVSGFGFVAAATVFLDFVNSDGDETRASDLAVIIESPDGNCRQIGGFDVDFGCNNGGFWPSSWQSTESGSYEGAATIGNAPEGIGTWFIRIGNGWSGSSGAYFSANISLWDLCLDVDPSGCMDPSACNYNPAAVQDDGSCDFETCFGCTDVSACNYSPGATLSDGSCEFTSCEGCTIPLACNFDFEATIDDGSCEYLSCLGCTNIDACNYDPNATIEDGSCYFNCISCAADLDNNGAVGVSDILILLSDFGCSTPPCIGDADDDGATNISDLLILLSAFGELCTE